MGQRLRDKTTQHFSRHCVAPIFLRAFQSKRSRGSSRERQRRERERTEEDWRREGTRKGGENGDLIRAGSGTLTVVVEEDKHRVSASKESEHNCGRWLILCEVA